MLKEGRKIMLSHLYKNILIYIQKNFVAVVKPIDSKVSCPEIFVFVLFRIELKTILDNFDNNNNFV